MRPKPSEHLPLSLGKERLDTREERERLEEPFGIATRSSSPSDHLHHPIETPALHFALPGANDRTASRVLQENRRGRDQTTSSPFVSCHRQFLQERACHPC